MISVPTTVKTEDPQLYFSYNVQCREIWLSELTRKISYNGILLGSLKNKTTVVKVLIRKTEPEEEQQDANVIASMLHNTFSSIVENVSVCTETKRIKVWEGYGNPSTYYKVEGPFYSSILVGWWTIFTERVRRNNFEEPTETFNTMQKVLSLPCEDYYDMYLRDDDEFFKEIWQKMLRVKLTEELLVGWIRHNGFQSFFENYLYKYCE